ncbi:general secretion pathway protein GspC [Marinobacter salinisoli]|uniref:General secretion pathway protein GspC n=1 Tax=Marinobacter salinisoli TaxID=2769486 RepID=A0ABX7MNU9_9GAMM|nr:type II secretion system protein N [Marinobacter salinisoli]QSP93960.1 general secretion pathway protein GspC [Marinobacter salinisoli]
MPLHNERLPLLLAVIAGAAMVIVTAWQAYSFWQSSQQTVTSPSQQESINAGSEARQRPEVNLGSLEFFGTASKDGEAKAVSTENLPKTNLRLFLRGVLAAEGEFPGSALIEDQKGNTDAYLVGDELPGNATLRSVHPNRVIIERSGKLENLFFPEDDNRSGLSVAANSDTRSSPSPSSRSSTSRSQPASQSGSSGQNDEARREEIRRRLEQLRERLRNNSN